MEGDDLELDLDLDNIDAQADSKLKVKNRFTELSDKVKTQAQEKEQALADKAKSEEARVTAEKERDFYKDFSSQAAKYPAATEHQTEIWDKVKGGYSLEDATVSVLANKGKLNGFTPETPPVPTFAPIVEGGSASTVLEGAKSNNDLSTSEKLQKLKEIDAQGGLMAALRTINTES